MTGCYIPVPSEEDVVVATSRARELQRGVRPLDLLSFLQPAASYTPGALQGCRSSQ